MPPQNFKRYQVPFGNDATFVNHPGAADIKILTKSSKFLTFRHAVFCKFSLVSLGIRPRSRRYAERTQQGEGRWSRPPKAALERSYSTENSSSANRILNPRQKQKVLTKSLKPKNGFIHIYKGSAWVPANAGTHASGRAGLHFELFDSILGRVKNVTTHNHSLHVQYVR